MFTVDDLLMESGRFWCVYQGPRMVKAFHGEGAKELAGALADRLNGGEHGER